LPLRLGLPIPQFDRVYVDEAQDLNPAKTALAIAAIRGSGCFVGDRHQAIYGFAGASSNSLDKIQAALGCQTLPLSISYRCASAIVEEAAKVFPGIQAHRSGGTVSEIDLNEFHSIVRPGDVVLCRTTAPVVQECLRFLTNGVKAVVKGREIGKDLIELVESFGCVEVRDLLAELGVWYQKKTENASEAKTILLNDKYDALVAIASEFTHTSAVVSFIAEIFGDEDASAITLMTIHKAKGLENDRIFILRPDLLPHKLAKSEEALKSEACLHYVAITRAKEELFYVV
jgi:superfamily I DNA/RNA helicase